MRWILAFVHMLALSSSRQAFDAAFREDDDHRSFVEPA